MSEVLRPHAYQKRAIRFLLENAAAGLFLDPGLGKTAVTYAALKLLLKRGVVRSLLVVAPLRTVYLVWPKEAKKWTAFHGLSVGLLHGPRKDECLRSHHDVYVINPEGLTWFEETTKFEKRLIPDVLVIDESTKFKHTRTLRFKTLKRLLPRFKRRYILTGTPAPNGLLDLFGQIYVLDGGLALGRYITRYRLDHFHPTGYGGYTWVPKPDAEHEIHKKIKHLVLRMSDEEYLTLPPKKTTTIYVDLPDEAMTTYQQLKRKFVVRLRRGEVTAVNAAAKTVKLRQLASGQVYLDSGEQLRSRKTEITHSEKVEATVDLVEELSGQPTLVAYEFRHDIPRLQKALGGDVPYLGGGVSAKRGVEIEEAWNRGELPVLLVHPQSAAHGLNLQGAGRAVIFFSLTWDLDGYDQLIRRVYRQGQTKPVFIYNVVARKTIDEVVLEALGSKNRTQRSLLALLEKRWR
jgi:SNF2 family DNA or RNA helicase